MLAEQAPEQVQAVLDLLQPLRVGAERVGIATHAVRHVLEQRLRLGQLGREAGDLGVERRQLVQLAGDHAQLLEHAGLAAVQAGLGALRRRQQLLDRAQALLLLAQRLVLARLRVHVVELI